MDVYQITQQVIDPSALLQALEDPGAGAQVLFLGTVRNEFEGRASQGLFYDVYPQMAEAQIRKIGEELKEEFSVRHIVIVHRIGSLPVGTISVAVAVSAAHRDAAFAAARAGIDRVKERVPIWKKEHWADGSSAWHDDKS
ncbi:MAG: molybdenum cofactor biosynthesis protein MoaE [Sulfobacillus thermotolerans]|uniref:Molybdopterin synthase n=1 Tax=Sulfobacillus thermotolerans TaxID=338644 RepID=A0ABM6RPZ6_9FIRM|nr:molybdopterin synthase [Sulfobacillus thermotolerans]MCY0906976.1 molybdenum cofactor biosynthesis protein MoaE [Sulfobacillus thermotolerans]